MPDASLREMVADWYGAGYAIHGSDDLVEWYACNSPKVRLHPETRARVDSIIMDHSDPRDPKIEISDQGVEMRTR